MTPTHRRDFLKQLAAVIPASAVLSSSYYAKAASMHKKVKVTDVKCMMVNGTRDWNMIKIETDSGLAGISEAYWGRGIKDIVLGYLRKALVGEDPVGVEVLYTKMMRDCSSAGSQAGTTVTAIGGVEIALWDLAGKILDAPVYELLGGKYREGVRAYWTSEPRDTLDPACCREYAAMLKSHPFGFTAIKSQADAFPRMYDPQLGEPGHDPYGGQLTPKDLSRIGRGFANLRAAVGDDIDIAVHCHWEFDWIDALELARAVAPIKPMWLEDPIAPEFSGSWVKLTQASPVPILTGENLYRRQGFEPFVVNQGCNIIHIDIPKTGGLLESKKIADLAEVYSIPVCVHNAAGPLGTVASAHCAASIRDFRCHEFCLGPQLTPETWQEYIVYEGPVIKDGKIRLLDKPGFGAEINESHVRANLAPGEEWWG